MDAVSKNTGMLSQMFGNLHILIFNKHAKNNMDDISQGSETTF